jgi:uncharacterized protein (TIGR03067 family)
MPFLQTEARILVGKEGFIMQRHPSAIEVLVSLLIVLGLLAGCSDGGPGGPGPAITELEGTWTGALIGDTATYSMTCSGSAFAFRMGSPTGMTELYGGTFSVDTTVSPREMDAYITRCTVNAAYVGQTSLCIYMISGDTLTYAGNEPGDPQRPTSFTPTGGTALFVLVRQ